MFCVNVTGTAMVDAQVICDCEMVAVLSRVVTWLMIEVTVVITIGCGVSCIVVREFIRDVRTEGLVEIRTDGKIILTHLEERFRYALDITQGNCN